MERAPPEQLGVDEDVKAALAPLGFTAFWLVEGLIGGAETMSAWRLEAPEVTTTLVGHLDGSLRQGVLHTDLKVLVVAVSPCRRPPVS